MLEGFSEEMWMEMRHATDEKLPRMADGWVPFTALERHMGVSRDRLLLTVLDHPDYFIYHVDEDVPDMAKAVKPEHWTNPSSDGSIFLNAYLALRGERGSPVGLHGRNQQRLLKVDELAAYLQVDKEHLLHILHQQPTVFDIIIDNLVGLMDAYF